MSASGLQRSDDGARRGIIALHLVAALAVSGLLSQHFFRQPLHPWTDQGYTLQAAIRHARGQGLTVQSGASRDLTRPSFDRLTYFPPGYPLLVSAMLRAGMEVETAVKVINAAALLIGMLGWLILGLPLLPSRALGVLYCALLVLACGGVVPSGGTTDVMFWAGVPWWILCVARARNEEGKSRIALLSVAALINAALILVRWAAAFLAPVAIVALMIPFRRGARDLMRNALEAIVVALPPTLTFLAISAINRRLSSSANVLSFVKPGWRPRYLLTLYPFESILAIPLGLKPILDRLWRSIDPTMHAAWGNALFRVALPLLLMGVLLASVWRAQLPRRTASVLIVVVLIAAGLLAFLAWMALRYNWDPINWSFLSEPRYYRPFLPAFLLGWLMMVDRLQTKRPRWSASVALLVLASLYLFQAAVRGQWSPLRERDESGELVTKVRSLTANPGLNLVFDIDVSDYIIHPEPNMIASGYIGEAELPRYYVGHPATLWFVRRVHESSAYLVDTDSDRRTFEANRKRFGAKRDWSSSAGSYELYKAAVH